MTSDNSPIPNEIVEFLQNPSLSYTYSIEKQQNNTAPSPTYVVSFSKPTPQNPIPATATYMYLKYKEPHYYFQFEGEKLWRKVLKGEFREEWVDLMLDMRERVKERDG